MSGVVQLEILPGIGCLTSNILALKVRDN